MALDLELVVIIFFLLSLFFLSLVESAISQSSSLVLRTMVERPEATGAPVLTTRPGSAGEPSPQLLLTVLEDKMQVLVPLNLGTQFSVITIAILTTHRMLRAWPERGLIYSFVAVLLISLVFRQLLPRLFTQNEPEKKLVGLLPLFRPVYVVLRPLALPMANLLKLHKRLHQEVENDGEPDGEETKGEEIQAYLEIGEDEGILQEEDSKLIQSVVEFGDTLVGKVMTPRTKIVACEETASMGELRETMVQHRHSRIPIYRGDMDHVIGIAYIRQLMAEYVKGRESDPITGLLNPVLFIPETKPVSKLLKELQARGDHAAIVIDEYGGVAGLVTIEDLVEEIVGEIWDEDEARVKKIIEEGPRSFVVRGSTELARLEELAGRKFENLNCSTVAGLVIAYLGRVPSPGEVFDLHGLSVRILDSDRKRVHWIRIKLPEVPSEAQGNES
jgi:CBS domain containing-hemolysin-like protein